MAAELGPRGHSLLLIVVLVTAGYAAWQVAPLSRRMDEIDRSRLETSDRLQREVEKLRDEWARARLMGSAQSAAAPKPAAAPREATPQSADVTAAPATRAASSAASPPPVRMSRSEVETYFERRLLSEDAKIATLLVEEVAPNEIAVRLKHSVAFIVAKGIQIERQLASAPETPPEILATLRAAVERAKTSR